MPDNNAVDLREPPLGCDKMGRRIIRQAEWIRGSMVQPNTTQPLDRIGLSWIRIAIADALRAVDPTECLHYFNACGYGQ